MDCSESRCTLFHAFLLEFLHFHSLAASPYAFAQGCSDFCLETRSITLTVHTEFERIRYHGAVADDARSGSQCSEPDFRHVGAQHGPT